MIDPLTAAFNTGVLAKTVQEAARGIREHGLVTSEESLADWLENMAALLSAPYGMSYKILNDEEESDDKTPDE